MSREIASNTRLIYNKNMLSLNLSFEPLYSLASTLVNGMLPVLLVPFGISLAFLVLAVITKAFRYFNFRRDWD